MNNINILYILFPVFFKTRTLEQCRARLHGCHQLEWRTRAVWNQHAPSPCLQTPTRFSSWPLVFTALQTYNGLTNNHTRLKRTDMCTRLQHRYHAQDNGHSHHPGAFLGSLILLPPTPGGRWSTSSRRRRATCSRLLRT